MSKIPVAKGGFRSWAAKNNETTSKSVLYEKKYRDHHDRMRGKENVTNEDRKASSSATPLSMINLQPTAEDYARYDADRQFRHTARDARIAQRAAESSSRKSTTPEMLKSPTTDEYYTPHRGSLSEMSDFETPATSKHNENEKRESRRSSSSSTTDKTTTPITSKPPKNKDHRDVRTVCLSRRMEQTFNNMQSMIFAGKSVLEARHEAISKTVESTRSPRGSRTTERTEVIVDRSSSQQPPIDVLERSASHSRRPASRDPSPIAKQENVSSSYVDTLVTAHQLHARYAETSTNIERQMTKVESLTKLADYAKTSDAVTTTKMDPIMAKKLDKIEKIKDFVMKLNVVLEAIHKIRFKHPYEMSAEDKYFLRSIDNWVHLQPSVFNRKSATQQMILTDRMRAARQLYNEKREEKEMENQARRRRRSSSALRMAIVPDAPRVDNPEQATAPTRGPSPPLAPRPGYPNKDVATQVSARNTVDESTQMTERQAHGVGRLDLSSLSGPSPSTEASDLNRMLESIQLNHNKSLDDVFPQDENVMEEQASILNISHDSRAHLMMDIKFPTGSATPEITPRSARSSLIGETSSRLSEGLKYALERCLVNNSFRDRSEDPMDVIVEQGEEFQEDQKAHAVPLEESKPEAVKPPEVNVELSTSTNSSPEEDINIKEEIDEDYDPDATQFEHEKEEREEARRVLQTPEGVVIDVETVQLEKVQTPSKPLAVEEEDEGDETKLFRSHDEFETAQEVEHPVEEQVETNGRVDESSDDSFLLNGKPPVRPKSILDRESVDVSSAPPTHHAPPAIPTPTHFAPPPHHSDTPRSSLVPANSIADNSLDASLEEMDLEEYCHGDFLVEISPIVINKAIELQDELRGVDMVDARSVWQPPVFSDFKLDIYDQFDIFDSFSILLWGAVVDLINRRYLKLGTRMTPEQEARFAVEAREMIQTEFGAESRENEWCNEVKLSKKLEGMMPLELDHRYDVRKGLPEDQKQSYQWQQIQMKVIDERFDRKDLESSLDAVYAEQKELLATYELMQIEQEAREELARGSESSESTDHVTVTDC